MKDIIARFENDIIIEFNEENSELFEKIEDFALRNPQLMLLCMEKGKKVIKSRDFAGVLRLNDGRAIEIYPRLGKSVTEAKGLLGRMVSAYLDMPFEKNTAELLDSEDSSFMEYFAAVFIREFSKIMKSGMLSGYTSIEENTNSMQGSILFSENIRRNLAHRERLYVRHDVFTPNRAENRLIKTAAAVLLKLVDSHVNKQELKKIIIQLDDVELCNSVERDFAACINTRNAKKYTAVLNICRMVLQKNSSGYFGKYVENAVFFSMQELFEVYISKLARAAREGKVVKALSKAGYLCRERKFFPLNPTISLYESDGSIYCVGNAKWQHITSANEINPDDIAKLYAAAEMTASDTAVMIFPSYGSIPDVELVFDFGRNVNLIIEFADFSEGSEVAEFICEVDEENEGISEYEDYGEIEDGEFVAVVGRQMAEPMEFPVEEKEKIPEVTAEPETAEIAKAPEKKRIKIVKRKR
ncbi:MAG: hypothetical protein IJN43_02930 [Ruminococcus sp.]|nr:hypothetical protein [Ruminococcus sp.]